MSRKLAIYFVLITVVIDAMGIGIIMPVMPDLIRELRGTGLSDAALWGGVLSSCFAVMQFLCGAAVGNLSDRYGRRPVLLASLGVVAVDYIIMGFTNSIWILFLGRIVGGIASATQSTASAYMADISKPDEKAQNFGLIGAAFGIGFILGPLLGGLLSEFGSRAPFFAAAVLATLNMCMGYFVLNETVTDAIRRPLEMRRMNPFRALKHVGSFPGLGMLLGMFFFHQVAFFVYPTVWAYYTQLRYDWQALQVGISLMAFGIGMAVVQGGLIRVIVPRIGEWNTVIMGLIVSIIAFALIGSATQGWMIYAIIPLCSIGLITSPALSGIMSRATPDNAQGELQGVMTAVGAIGTIISPLMMTGSFSYFTRPDAPIHFPSAPFALAVVLEIIALGLFMIAMRGQVVRAK
ncbi:UNVERIFIED_CONTAM: hypothetical protein GTU68_005233 [Idotea baltica]|nr:hypothetical protein [Idotea baltica]